MLNIHKRFNSICRQRFSHQGARPRHVSSAAGRHAREDGSLDTSFYSILDVPHTATAAEIRQGYLRLMREFHPDLHRNSDSITELCAIINQVYETLSDEKQRETYDLIAGYSELSINPFLDPSPITRDQLFVDEANCIGCGKCVRWAPGTFEIEASKYGRARVINQKGNTEEEISIAIEVCPVDTIHYVSTEQLQLLESALARMPLIEVFIMQRSGQSPGNVFQEASRNWERRRGGRSSSRVNWDFAGRGAEAGSGDPGSVKMQGVAKLAANAARAMRLWRMRKESEGALISD